jgi:hypothetical protein
MKKIILSFIFLSLGAYAYSAEKAAPEKNPLCPLVVVSGASIGPIKLGMSKKNLEMTSFTLSNSTVSKNIEITDCGPFKVKLDNARVTEIWIDDIFKYQNCLKFKGKLLKERLVGQALLNFFGGGKRDNAPPVSGTYYICAKGGVWLGTPSGSTTQTVQLRIRKKK